METRLDYASLGRRLGASFIDLILVGILGLFLNALLPFLGGLLALFFYVPVLESSRLQATLGKNLMGIQVADLAGGRISLRAATVRWIVKSFSSVLCFVGHFFALFTEKKQALHDLLADTVVVYGRSPAPVGEAWFESARSVFSGITLGGHVASTSELQSVEALERLQALREKGTITDAEFETEKKRILGGQSATF
ncbi:MAG: RDD family protein [Bdellovibrionota bacterium]